MLGLAFEEVTFDGPLGSYPAWFVPGSDSTWVLYVHGRATDRPECLRTLSVLAARGLPGFLVTYRNDVGAPRSPVGSRNSRVRPAPSGVAGHGSRVP